jgi:hypothetical protein
MSFKRLAVSATLLHLDQFMRKCPGGNSVILRSRAASEVQKNRYGKIQYTVHGTVGS